MTATTALVLVDLQGGNFEGTGGLPDGNRLLHTARSLLEAAREAGVPIIHVQHSGPPGSIDEPGAPGWQFHPTVAPVNRETVVGKQHPDAFQDTTLQQCLDDLNIKRVVIAGLQTEYCIDTTCRRAYSLGYDVVLVEDGHGTWDSGQFTAKQIIAHHNAVLGSWFATVQPASDVRFHDA